MLSGRWASTALPDKSKEVSSQVMALKGPSLSTQHSPWLPCLTLLACGLSFIGLGVLDGRDIHMGMYGFVLGSGSDPLRYGAEMQRRQSKE